jgi:hypothetical protein
MTRTPSLQDQYKDFAGSAEKLTAEGYHKMSRSKRQEIPDIVAGNGRAGAREVPLFMAAFAKTILPKNIDFFLT